MTLFPDGFPIGHEPSRHATSAAGSLTGLDPESVATELFKWSERLVGVEGAVIHMASDRGLDVTWVGEGAHPPPEVRFVSHDGPGPIARAYRYAATQIVSEEEDLCMPLIRAFNWRSAVCVPLIVDETVIGVFSAGWRAPFPVSPEVRLVLEAAASLGASVLDRMGLLHHLKREQQRLRNVLEGLPVAASIVEIESLRVRWRNSLARRLFGDVKDVDVHTMMAKGRMGLLDTSAVPSSSDLRSVLRGETAPGRTTLRTADGQWRVLTPTVAQIDGESSVVIHVDVTHDAHMERERSRFVHMVSHHLRTPLTPILGYTHLLADSQLDDGSRCEAAAAVASSVTQLTHLVSRLEQIASLRPVDPLAMGRYRIEELILEAWEPVGELDSHLLKLSGATAREVHCAREHVVGALTELFANAVTHGAPPVDVRVEGDTDVRLRISDAGSGISAEWEKAVFVPFLSAGDGYLAPASDHVGLGLSLARGLILATGGELTYDDGSFWVRLAGSPT